MIWAVVLILLTLFLVCWLSLGCQFVWWQRSLHKQGLASPMAQCRHGLCPNACRFKSLRLTHWKRQCSYYGMIVPYYQSLTPCKACEMGLRFGVFGQKVGHVPFFVSEKDRRG